MTLRVPMPFQPKAGWYGEDVDRDRRGIGMLMAEKPAQRFVWECFMKNREIAHAMREVAFPSRSDANTQVL